MQNLGLSESTPAGERRLKSLFWPNIRSDADVDYLTTQGFRVVTAIGILAAAIAFGIGIPSGIFVLLLYLLGACGVRRRSRFAAVMLFALLLPSLPHPGALQLMALALLLANIRAVWLAHRGRNTGEADSSPPLLAQTTMDVVSDHFPKFVWPAGRFVFYVPGVFMINRVYVPNGKHC
jgi:hypothetical protein